MPGATWVKRYFLGNLSLHSWPIGEAMFSMALPRAFRLRQVSSSGRYGVAHGFAAGAATLSWVDFQAAAHHLVARDDVDHAAINAEGNFLAWAARGAGDVVKLRFASVAAAGVATIGATPRSVDNSAVPPRSSQ